MNRQLLSLAFLACILTAPTTARAIDVEASPSIGGLDAVPKGLGTVSTPLRISGNTAGNLNVIPGVDLKNFDGALGAVQLPASQLLQMSRTAGLGFELPNSPLATPQAILTPSPLGPETPFTASAENTGADDQHQAPSAQNELGTAAGEGQGTQKEGAPKPAEELGVQGEKTFDGTQETAASAPAPVAQTRLGRWFGAARATLARTLPTRLVIRVKTPKVETPSTKDVYGGPLKLELDLKGKISYGIKWGLNMLGLGALLQVAAKAVSAVLPWQLIVPDSVLQSTGRAELLARMGPKAIDAALVHAPWHFLFVQLPSATLWEEVGQLPIMLTSTGFRALELGVLWLLLKGTRNAAGQLSKLLSKLPDPLSLRSAVQVALEMLSGISNKALFFTAAGLTLASFFAPPLHIALAPLTYSALGSRVFGFGLLWSVLAAVKPVSAKLAEWLEAIPDLFGLRSGVQTGLGQAGRISNKAFPIAALISGLAFAANHFAAWGVSPYLIALQTTMGVTLAYIGYKTRSVFVPFVAHYTFNLLTLGGALLAAHFLMPVTAQIYALLLGLGSVGYLYFNFRSHFKAKAQAKAQARQNLLARSGKVVLPLLLAAVMTGSLLAPQSRLSSGSADNNAVATQAMKAWPIQDKDDKAAAPKDAPADAKPAADQDDQQPTKTISLSGAIDEMTVAATAKAKPAVVKIFSGNALGSGYIVSADGYTISNAHVVGAAQPGDVLKMEFSDGSPGQIKVLAVNHDKDIAILQLPPNKDGWPFLPIGSNDGLAEGQTVLAMGYPLGLPFTVTRGIVSGLGGGRGSIYVQQLQTDAAINHGNSGGALINMNGEVVGMNTAIASPTEGGGSIGIGFSITADDIKAAMAQFKATGNMNSSWLGIIVNEGNPLAPDLGILVDAVRPGSPAWDAGVRSGDLIIGAEGHRFTKDMSALETLARVVAHHAPGEKLSLLVASRGEAAPVTVTLANEPGAQTTAATPAPPAPKDAKPAPAPSIWSRFTGALSAVLRAIFSGLSNH